MIVWVRLYFKPSGLRCEMTVTPLEWVLGRDKNNNNSNNIKYKNTRVNNQSSNPLAHTIIIQSLHSKEENENYTKEYVLNI